MTVYRVVRASDTVIADTDGQVMSYDEADDVFEPREGGSGGAVDSVNGQTGTVVLGASDVGAQPAGSYATAAQGALADTAVQPGDDAGTLGSGAATSGQVLTADGSGAASWQEAGGGGLPVLSGAAAPYAITRLSNAASIPLVPVGARSIATARPVDAAPVRMNLMPVTIGADLPVTGLAVSITGATAGGAARFGIYGTAPDAGPGDLLWDSGSVPAETTGIVALTVSLTLPAGTLWVCAAVSGVNVHYYGWDAGALGSPDAWPPAIPLPRGYVLRTDAATSIITGGYPASLATADMKRGHGSTDAAPVIYARVTS